MLEKKGLTVGFVILTALVSWGCNPTFDSGAHIRWKFGVFQVSERSIVYPQKGWWF